MARIEVQLASEYGIMFLSDTAVRPEYPQDAGEQGLTSTSTCLAVSVLSYVDGDARIVIVDDPSAMTLNGDAFCGLLVCKSKSLSLFDTNYFPFVNIPLKEDVARVVVRLSEPRNPELVECLVTNMVVY